MVLTALMMIGVAVSGFPVICAWSEEAGDPLPGWLYASAGAGAYAGGPTLSVMSVSQKWGIGRYGAAVAASGWLMYFAVLSDEAISREPVGAGKIVLLGAALALPHLCLVTSLLAIARRTDRKE